MKQKEKIYPMIIGLTTLVQPLSKQLNGGLKTIKRKMPKHLQTILLLPYKTKKTYQKGMFFLLKKSIKFFY